jgi:plasmid maintenance system antidote protein VapI
VASAQDRAGQERHREYLANYIGFEGLDKVELKELAEGIYLTDARMHQRRELLYILKEIPGFLGTLIETVMKENRHDRTEVARRLEVSPRSVEAWTKGHHIQERATAERLADYIGYAGEDKESFVSTAYYDQRANKQGKDKDGAENAKHKERLDAKNARPGGNKVGT